MPKLERESKWNTARNGNEKKVEEMRENLTKLN